MKNLILSFTFFFSLLLVTISVAKESRNLSGIIPPKTQQNQSSRKDLTTHAKIKSCLSSIYHHQMNHYRARGKYTTATEDMGVDRNETCNGLYIYTNIANKNEFKVTAKFGKNVWTVDQSRNIMKAR